MTVAFIEERHYMYVRSFLYKRKGLKMNDVQNFDMKVLSQKKMLTRKEAAFYMGISCQTLNRIIKARGFYPLARIGFGQGCTRVNRDKLEQWLDEQDESYSYLN